MNYRQKRNERILNFPFDDTSYRYYLDIHYHRQSQRNAGSDHTLF